MRAHNPSSQASQEGFEDTVFQLNPTKSEYIPELPTGWTFVKTSVSVFSAPPLALPSDWTASARDIVLTRFVDLSSLTREAPLQIGGRGHRNRRQMESRSRRLCELDCWCKSSRSTTIAPRLCVLLLGETADDDAVSVLWAFDRQFSRVRACEPCARPRRVGT